MAMESNLSNLVERFEANMARLERAVNKLAAEGIVVGRSENSPTMVAEFEDILNGKFNTFKVNASKLGNLVEHQCDLFHDVLYAEYELIKLSSKFQKPADLKLVGQAISQGIAAVVDFKEKNRLNKENFNYLSVISEGVPALGWVLIAPTPVPFIEESIQAAQFYANKIIMMFKGKDQNKIDYANSFTELLKELQYYVKKNHTTGLSWNSKGEVGPFPAEAITWKPRYFPEPIVESKPPVITKGQDSIAKVHETKVTESEKLPEQSVAPKAAPITNNASENYNTVVPGSKPAKFSRQGVKWIVQHQVGNKTIEITETNQKQTIYIYKCADSLVRVHGKVKHVAIDGCIKTGVVFEEAIVSCEAVNCTSLQIQVVEKVPSIAIDKCTGVQIFLSKTSLNAEIISSKSSEMNLVIPSSGDDIVELPVPEQYVTRVVEGKLVTELVSHTGA